MAKILIVYATKKGQTEKIARFMGEELKQAGHSVDLHNCNGSSRLASIQTYDSVIVGGPVYAHNFPRGLRRWVQKHATELAIKPTSFFSVCLGILEKKTEVQEDEKKLVEAFFTQTGWYPQQWTIFAGALPYTKYNWFIRWVMKNITAKAGGDTDTSRNYEYTDWNLVRSFASKSTALLLQQGLRNG